MTLDVEVTRARLRLRPDPSRVVARLFVPGQEGLIVGESRAGSVVERILALDDATASAALAGVYERFSDRHRDLGAVLDEHFELVSHRFARPLELSDARRRLVGSYFTQELAVEAAALCNPSLVAHPDQAGTQPGETRGVMSLRAIGEGHISSVEFRTGIVDEAGSFRLDEPGSHIVAGSPAKRRYRTEHFRRLLHASGDWGSSASFVLDSLAATFDVDEMEVALRALRDQIVTRGDAERTIERFRQAAASNYEVSFPETSSISERVLLPSTPAESHGMEDARFVRFVDDDGTQTYFATYTAYDGAHIAPHLLETGDFRTFRSTQMTGKAATNKGLALFPRRVGGSFAALSRWDREGNALVFSDDPTSWEDPVPLDRSNGAWDLVQRGNCGSPIETADGWLVLTHGVGPMRSYAIGAELLDLEDPTRLLGQLHDPLVVPEADERDGYVPNVVYSCGSLVVGDTLVVPYGMSDASVGVVTVSLGSLLERLVGC
jgi:predicted GH43/DUF377 family glycosyl hydrolase